MSNDLQYDRDLAERARQGDDAAWRTIYDATCDGLFAFLCYQIGDRDEARDILQETYLQAFRKLDRYRGEAPLEIWLHSIALGRSLDWKRVILRRIKRTTRLDESSAWVEPDVHGVRFDSESAALQQALAKLSHHQRAALLLRECEGRSFREVSELLGCAEATARVHYVRARERMRAALSGNRHALGACDWEGQQT
jgi:RNA polymerase sigma-70 factor (ECF subfamily)